MNVSLVSKRNVPDDAIISIRSGVVRRQGAANANKPFVFPQSAIDGGDCVVKVDIMQNIGSGYIVLRPNQKEGRQYEVILGENDMACEIKIDPTGGESPSAPAEDDAATAKTKQAAKQYLDGTGLLPFVQGVLQVVAKQQPQDPFAAMAKHFNSASDEAVAPMPGSPKAAPTSPTKALPESPKAMPESPKATPESPKAASESPESPKAEATETAEAAAPAAEAAVGTPRLEAPDESEQKASPSAAEEAAPAEGQAEASKADKEEDDVDDHKSVDDVDVEFTATVRGKNLAAEAEEEKPNEQEEENPKGAEAEEEKPNEQEEKSEEAKGGAEGEEKEEDATKEGEEKAEDATEAPAADAGAAEAGAEGGTAE